MKRVIALFFFVFLFCSSIIAQVNDLELAKQYTSNNELQKALDIYQKLYKQDNDTYYPYYLSGLLNIKKFDDAESITKKMLRKYPEEYQYRINLGRIYTQKGTTDKANAIYDDLIKNLPPNASAITNMATQFYQGENIDYAIKVFLKGRKLLYDDNLYSFELISLYRYKKDKIALTEEYLTLLLSNPSFITQTESTLSALYEGAGDYDMLKVALLKRIQKYPQQTCYTDLLIWQFLQQKEFEQALTQSLALSRRQGDDGNSIFDLCETLVSNEAYETAIKGYEYIISKGKEKQFYVPAKIELLNTKNLLITAGKYTQPDLLSLEKDYIDLIDEFGKTNSTVFAMQQLAKLQAFKLHKLNEAQKLLEEAINIPNIKMDLLNSCKLDLGDVYLINQQPWEATLLYGQVETSYLSTPIGQDAKFRNAKLAYYTGDFNWGKGQLDVLKAATSQLIANDALNLSLLITDNLVADTSGAALKMYARADLQIFAQQPEKAVAILDSIDVKYPNNSLKNDILMAKGRILIAQKNYTGAILPLKKIVDEQPFNLWADDAVFMLGDIYENHLANKEQAKIFYQKIITDYPDSLWINEARKRFRLLRGDKLDAS